MRPTATSPPGETIRKRLDALYRRRTVLDSAIVWLERFRRYRFAQKTRRRFADPVTFLTIGRPPR